MVEEGAGGLMNRGIAANVEPGVETRVALKDDVDVVVGGRVEDCWELCVAFWEGTRGWALSGGKTSFRAPEDHLTIENVMLTFLQLLTNFILCFDLRPWISNVEMSCKPFLAPSRVLLLWSG